MPNKLSLTQFFTVIIGNIFEWYEFSLFAYFASQISAQFFPNENKLVSLLQVFGVFAVGYLMRPIGALYFGYQGDKLGRKKMLSLSMMIMASATTVIGLIPSYQSIGILAPVLLIACRMVQGFVLGGEYSGAVVYLIEQSAKPFRNLWGSMPLFGCYAGMLLGSFVSAVVSHFLSGTEYYAYAWRCCFIIASGFGLLGVYIRNFLPESLEFKESFQKKILVSNPLKVLFKNHFVKVLLGTGVTLLPAVTSYILLTYLPTHLTQFGNLSLPQALYLNTGVILVMLFIIPLVGIGSERLGKSFFLYSSALGIGCVSLWAFHIFNLSSLKLVFLAQIMIALLSCFSEAIIPIFLAQLFPVSVRYSGIALCLNLANGIFGGTAPLVATWLIIKTHNTAAPAYYLMAVAVVAFCSLIGLRSVLKQKFI